MLTRGIEKGNCENSRETREKILCFVHQSQVLPLQLQEILAFIWLLPNACIVAELESVFSILRVHSKFEYGSLIPSYSGNEMSFGR
jgi:hypothetical protein